MHLNEFLQCGGLTQDDILAEANAQLQLRVGDMLVLCGSLVEGLGNEKSDIDLLLITTRRDISQTSLGAVTLAVGKAIVDIRLLNTSDVDSVVQRFRDWGARRRHVRDSTLLNEVDRKLLHRLRTGRAVHGAEDFERIQSQVGRDDLARHRLDCARYAASALQVDLAGFRGEGDVDSLLFASQELLNHTIDALLAAYGCSNPNGKWRVRELSELPTDWESHLPGRGSGMLPNDLYLALHRAPQARTATATLDHALRIAAFSRRVFPWAEWRLLRHSLLPILPGPAGDRRSRSVLPHLDVDVTITYGNGVFELYRLNGSGQLFTLDPATYALLTLFDGCTPVEDASAYAENIAGREQRIAAVDDLLALVRYADFEARHMIDRAALKQILAGSAHSASGVAGADRTSHITGPFSWSDN